jgi:tetratricopeptide (TPR) repeat protein
LADWDTLGRVDLLLERSRTHEARALLSEAASGSTRDVEVLVRLARADLIDDKDDDAKAHLFDALSLDPEHEAGRYLLAAVHSDSGEYAESEALLVELIREAPEDVDYLALYARVMLLTLHFEKAGRLAEEAIRLDPSDRNALRCATLVAAVSGEPEKAREALTELVENYPLDEGVLRLLLRQLVHERRHREAEVLGRELLQLHPDDEELVDLLIELRTLTHPIAWPAYPFIRWGWTGSAVIWGIYVFGSPTFNKHYPSLATPVAIGYLAWVVYSWTYQALLRKWFRRRGFG